jgi:hypothetical protein
MHRVEMELKIPVFERAKTVHALDRAATVIGWLANAEAKEDGSRCHVVWSVCGNGLDELVDCMVHYPEGQRPNLTC